MDFHIWVAFQIEFWVIRWYIVPLTALSDIPYKVLLKSAQDPKWRDKWTQVSRRVESSLSLAHNVFMFSLFGLFTLIKKQKTKNPSALNYLPPSKITTPGSCVLLDLWVLLAPSFCPCHRSLGDCEGLYTLNISDESKLVEINCQICTLNEWCVHISIEHFLPVSVYVWLWDWLSIWVLFWTWRAWGGKWHHVWSLG